MKRFGALLVLLGAACGGHGGGGRMVQRDSAGVAILENVGGERGWGGVDTIVGSLLPPDSGLRTFPWAVVADPGTGRIYAADAFASRVVVFDRRGGRVGTFGRRGGGPGEFESLSALAVADTGVVEAWDAGRGELSRWSTDGTSLGRRRAPLAYWGPGFSDWRGTLVAVVSRSDGLRLDQLLTRVSEGDTTVLATVSRERVAVTLRCGSFPFRRILAPDVVWAARGDTVYVARGTGYRIDVYVGGVLRSSIRREVGPVAVTEGMAVERVGNGQFRGFIRRCGVTAEQLVRAVGYETEVSPIAHLVVDPAGWLWVSRGSPAGVADSTDVIDASGRYRGTVVTGSMPVAFVSDSVFVGFGLGQLGEVKLGLYGVPRHRARKPD